MSVATRPVRPRVSRFVRRALIVAAIAVGTAVILAGLWFGVHALLLIFAGVLLAIALRGLADAASRSTGLSPQRALWAVVLTLALAAGGLGWFLAPGVTEQFEELSAALPKAVEKVGETEWGRRLLGEEKPESSPLRGAFGAVGKAFAVSLGAIGDLVVVLFLSVFLAADAGRYRDGLLRFVPPEWRDDTEHSLHEARDNLRRWFIGRITDMTYVGTLTYVGLWALGVPLALPLALVTALLCFVPFFGPILATVPAVLMGLTVGPWTGLYVVLLYLAVQLTEGNIVTPLIEQQAVSIPPAVTLSSVLLLGVWTGPLGMALAVPLTLLGWLALKRTYLRDA